MKMEQYTITYKGLTRYGSDKGCDDGECADLFNLCVDGAELRQVEPPTELRSNLGDVFSLPQGETVAYSHRGDGYWHMIVTKALAEDKLSLAWYDMDTALSESSVSGLPSSGIGELVDITGVGNTLVVSTTLLGTCYLLWTGENYRYLGNSIPDVDLQFGLSARSKYYHSIDWDGTGTWTQSEINITGWDGSSNFTPEQKAEATEQVLALVNRYINECGTKSGRFLFPFFVRYALRLYDDSLTHHSAPILMMPSSKVPVEVIGFGVSPIKVEVSGFPCDLTYDILDSSQFSALHTDWSDIVKGVEIFVSAPIWTYDQNGEVTGVETWDFEGARYGDVENHGMMLACFDTHGDEVFPQVKHDFYVESHTYDGWQGLEDVMDSCLEPIIGKSQWWSLENLNSYFHCVLTYYDSHTRFNNHKRFRLPGRTDAQVIDDLKHTSNFYHIKTIDITGTETEETVYLDLSGGELIGLLGREQMTDDFESHEHKYSSMLSNYNGRLHLSGVERYLYSGYSFCSMMQKQNSKGTLWWLGNGTNYNNYAEGWRTLWLSDLYDADNANPLIDVTVNSRYKVLAGVSKESLTVGRDESVGGYKMYNGCDGIPCNYWFYYPDPKASLMYLTLNRTVSGVLSKVYSPYEMKEHELLNGSYYYGIAGVRAMVAGQVNVTPDARASLPNSIYVSEVNNPFTFLPENVVTVGNGIVKGIASNTQALSQGQFGEHPMFAFCSDGVWALQVSGTGAYASVQPVSRDVCSDPSTITQLDSSVLFATDKGLMMLSGSDVKCVSEALEGEVFALGSLQSADAGDTFNGYVAGMSGAGLTDVTSFRTYMDGALIAYDYKGERVIISNNHYNYSYVLMLRGGKWSRCSINGIVSVVNDYPDTIIQSGVDCYTARCALNEEDYESEEPREAWAVTRALKMGDILTRKSLQDLRNVGNFDFSQYAVLGSDDCKTWRLLHSLHGRGYKFYRLVLFCETKPGQRMTGTAVTFDKRMDWKMR